MKDIEKLLKMTEHPQAQGLFNDHSRLIQLRQIKR